MSSGEIGRIVLTLSVLVACVHGLGYVFERLRQPKLVGEILAGILLGPFVLGAVSPAAFERLFQGTPNTDAVLDFVYWLGLLLLMFCSGSETRRLMARENRRETAWLVGLGTPLPFLLVLFLGLAGFLPLQALTGSAGQPTSTLLILSIAVAVTSIPVISRIFHDLKIMHTRFASLILGASVVEDIVLWGVLAVATALAQSAPRTEQQVMGEISGHVLATLVYMVVGLTVLPSILRMVHYSRWNLVYRASPVGYVVFVLFLYSAIAAAVGVNLVFAAFLAGYGVIGGVSGSERERLAEPLDAVAKFSFAFFVPVYFGVVGFKLVFGRDFSLSMVLLFLIASTLLALLAVGLAARMAGFRGLSIVNIAVTMNARGGPGIVLATIAYEAGIINAAFYTTLVLTAVLTSQAAGAWLQFLLRRGLPLLEPAANAGRELAPAAGPVADSSRS